jgi:hypothetical protein
MQIILVASESIHAMYDKRISASYKGLYTEYGFTLSSTCTCLCHAVSRTYSYQSMQSQDAQDAWSFHASPTYM